MFVYPISHIKISASDVGNENEKKKKMKNIFWKLERIEHLKKFWKCN